MKIFRRNILSIIIVLLSVNVACQAQKSNVADSDISIEKQIKKKKKEKKKRKKKVKLQMIDLSHWKVTLPVTNDEGKPYEIEPPEILNFAKNEIAKPYMYIDCVVGVGLFVTVAVIP